MLIKNMLLAFIGLSGGFAIAGGAFSFLVMIGVLPRLASKTKTVWAYWQYETAVIAGGVLGNIISLYSLTLQVGYVGLILFGLFSGIYIGCFAMALAEVLNVLPIFARRIKLKEGMAYIVLFIAIGKAIGSWYQLCYPVWTGR